MDLPLGAEEEVGSSDNSSEEQEILLEKTRTHFKQHEAQSECLHECKPRPTRDVESQKSYCIEQTHSEPAEPNRKRDKKQREIPGITDAAAWPAKPKHPKPSIVASGRDSDLPTEIRDEFTPSEIANALKPNRKLPRKKVTKQNRRHQNTKKKQPGEPEPWKAPQDDRSHTTVTQDTIHNHELRDRTTLKPPTYLTEDAISIPDEIIVPPNSPVGGEEVKQIEENQTHKTVETTGPREQKQIMIQKNTEPRIIIKPANRTRPREQPKQKMVNKNGPRENSPNQTERTLYSSTRCRRAAMSLVMYRVLLSDLRRGTNRGSSSSTTLYCCCRRTPTAPSLVSATPVTQS